MSRKECFGETLKLSFFPTRDLDQDGDDTTHCANATFLTDAAGNNWRRGGWWHAGDVTVQYLFVICLLFLWAQKLGIFMTYVKGVITLQYLFVRVQGDPKYYCDE